MVRAGSKQKRPVGPEYTGLQPATQLCGHGELTQSRDLVVTLMSEVRRQCTSRPPTCSQGWEALHKAVMISLSSAALLSAHPQDKADPHWACQTAK